LHEFGGRALNSSVRLSTMSFNISATQELFGGAIKAAIPSNAVDASYVTSSLKAISSTTPCATVLSDFRQVPDTQELFIFPDTNVSMIIEVLERVEADDPIEAAKLVHPSFPVERQDPA
jgi:hypothetical protein